MGFPLLRLAEINTELSASVVSGSVGKFYKFINRQITISEFLTIFLTRWVAKLNLSQ